MSLIEKIVKTPYTVRWMWPLYLGLPRKIGDLKGKILQGYWSQTFVRIGRISNSNHYNIILFDASIDEEDYRSWVGATSDIIFIILQNGMTEDLKNRATNLQNHFKASGVFIFNVTDISDWFGRLIEELSHNNNLVEALKRTAVVKLSLFDPKIKLQTTLSYVIRQMSLTLKSKLHSKRVFKVKLRSRRDKANFTGEEIAKILQSELTYFDSESQSASDLKHVSQEVFKKSVSVQYREADTVRKTTGAGGVSAKRAIAKGIQKPKKKTRGYKTTGNVSDILGSTRSLKINRVKKSKKAAKKAAPKKAAKKAAPKKAARISERKEAPRYLQANIQTAKNKIVKDFLKPETKYFIDVRIGYEDKKFVDSGQEFPGELVFKNSKRLKEKIQIKFTSNLDDNVELKEIDLPRQGNSTSVLFGIKTKLKIKSFEGNIFAYHKNRLIQHVKLTAAIGKNIRSAKSTIKLQSIFSSRKNLGNVNDRTTFAASVEYRTGPKNSSKISGINKNQPIDLFFPNGLKVHLDDMKRAIEDALINIKKHPAKLSAKGNEELLKCLALKGNLIYTNCLRGAIAPDGPLQIITNYQEYAPLEFVYTLPAPKEEATLCNNASIALKDGACKNCFDTKESPAPHICPFGFWSFSRVLERHSYKMKKNNRMSDYSVLSEPIDNRNCLNILQRSIYASSYRVETSETKGLRKQIGASIKKQSKTFIEVEDWETWSEEMRKNKPDSLFLIVHIEKDRFNIDELEIGKNFLSQNYFDSSLIVNKDPKPPPFIIIIGCESTNLATGGFDVSSQLMNCGAAIVLSNFTKIRGRQAKDIILKLVDFLKANGQKETLLGNALLKLRQFLLSEGLIAGLSLVANGDADWKIKT